MGRKAALGGIGLMLLGVGLPPFLHIDWAWGGFLSFIGLILLLVSCRHLIFRSKVSGSLLAGLFHSSISSNSEDLSLQPHIFLRATATNGDEGFRVATWKLSATLGARVLAIDGPLVIPDSYVFYRSQTALAFQMSVQSHRTEYPTERLDDPTRVEWSPNEMRVGWLYFTAKDADENEVRNKADLRLEITDTKGRTTNVIHQGGDSWPESWKWLDSMTIKGDFALRSMEGNKPPASLRYFSK